MEALQANRPIEDRQALAAAPEDRQALEATRSPRAADFGRRALDLVVALSALLVLAPLLLALAVAIRIDTRGPALFRQRRIGRDGRPFTLVKFRSMQVDADPGRHREYVRSLIAAGTPATAGEEPRDGLYKLAVDDRVTRLGRILRRLSLDELPQLWNVLRGEMALVGPRPVIEYEVDNYPADWHERFAVKPGLTGLWQVSGRNERTYEEMVRFDIDYVRRRSLGLDLTILLRTGWTVVTAKGAA